MSNKCYFCGNEQKELSDIESTLKRIIDRCLKMYKWKGSCLIRIKEGEDKYYPYKKLLLIDYYDRLDMPSNTWHFDEDIRKEDDKKI